MFRHLHITTALFFTSFYCFAESPVSFSVRKLAVDANEGIAAGDIDGDGKIDLVAGRFWYQNPDWAPRPLRNIDDWNGYVQSNGDFLFDVNQDGRLDVIAGSFLPTEVYWYENPGGEDLRLGKLWKQHLLANTPQSRNEGTLFEDVDGDGVPEWITPSWAKNVPMYLSRLEPKSSTKKSPSAFKLVSHQIGQRGNGHAGGVGDLNGDGRNDVIVGQGWYEQPKKPWSKEWKFHPNWDLHASLPVIVVDVNEDGRNDIIWGQGHDFGLFWWQNEGPNDNGELKFEEHVIDREYSQTHTLAWTDLTGDGQPELITGKRYYAHNGNDKGGKMPPVMYYYTLDRKTKKFQRHIIEEGHVGTGLQIAIADLNGDSRVDLAVAGKSGTHLLISK